MMTAKFPSEHTFCFKTRIQSAFSRIHFPSGSFMTLAIFDLDNTLLKGDSDHAWGEFISSKGLVDGVSYRKQNDAFYQAYLKGTLDIFAYQNFCLSVIAGIPVEQLQSLLNTFLTEVVEGMITPQSEALIKKHQQQGHHTLIITATNEVITRPIAKRLGIKDLIATQAEVLNGKYSGKVAGIPSYKEGKITRLHKWLEEHPHLTMQGSYFYSDSHNDLPLLEEVTYAFAVDPDETLKKHAEKKGWPVMSLRN
jgi:HAD superfamily hydrolase (TIGR01490 family)